MLSSQFWPELWVWRTNSFKVAHYSLFFGKIKVALNPSDRIRFKFAKSKHVAACTKTY